MKKRLSETQIIIIAALIILTLMITAHNREGSMRFMQKYYPERYAVIYGELPEEFNITQDDYRGDLYRMVDGRVYRRTTYGWSAAYPVPYDNK
ncbi:MAG: hypothetical protein Q8R00_00170 [Candidatus Nanoarchaeia archaeon]|nr:hypothetical protein [Candidatus Nanoarchaeia archaeon]